MGNVEVALRSSENVMKLVKCVRPLQPISNLNLVLILLHRAFPLQLISAQFLLISQVHRN